MGFLDAIFNLDCSVIQSVADNFRSPFMTGFMKAVTLLGEHGIFLIICALVCIIIPKTRKLGITMGIALLLGFLFGNLLIKNVVARPRPYTLARFSDLLLVSELSDWSFPSGHTLAAFECAVAVFIYHKKIGVAAIIAAVLIAFSRIYLVAHYPSDVIVGALMGILFAIAAYYIVKALYKKFPKLVGKTAE